MNSFHLNPLAEQGFGYAQAVEHRGRLCVSGTLSLNDDFSVHGEGDMAAQLRCAYRRIAQTLRAHGLSERDVIRERLFVTDMDAMLASNPVRLDIYGSHFPACTIVEVVRLAFPACLVEIEVEAEKAG